MAGSPDHGAHVDAWLRREAHGLSPESLVELLERALDAVWQRALQPLGEVTLTAIADRVLYTAAERFPPFTTLSFGPTGVRCGALRENAADLPREELMGGIRFILIELLTVLGSLTANILTPALHAELEKVTGSSEGPGKGPTS